jgi:CRP-like cAMP-binding protein
VPPEEQSVYIYKTGDPAKGAYLSKDRRAIVEGPHLPQIEVDVDNVLLGAVELFLATGRKVPDRIFDLKVPTGTIVEPVAFDTVLSMARTYDFGLNANRFLAILIERTNKVLKSTIDSMGSGWSSYRSTAATFVDVVDRLMIAATESGIQDYLRLARAKASTSLYRDGANFHRERFVSRISTAVESAADAVRFAQSQRLCSAGDSSDCLYILLEGQVYVSRDGQLLATITEPGECFGELSFMLNGKRVADLVAAEQTALLRIKRTELRAFHKSHPEMFIQIAQTLAQRLNQNLILLERYHAEDTLEASKSASELEQNARKELHGLVEEMRRLLRIASVQEVVRVVNYAAAETSRHSR